MRTAALGAALLFLISIIVAIFPELNARFLPNIYWFIAPTVVILFVIFKWCDALVTGVDPTLDRETALIASAGLGMILGALGIWFTGVQSVRDGIAILPGDRFEGSTKFRAAVSIMALISAGFVEEPIIRGKIQFHLRPLIGAPLSELVSGLVSVVVHFLRLSEFHEAAYVVLLTTVSGRIATMSQSIAAPTIVHVVSNLTIVMVVLAFR
jgi:membrane protease YdiL (CAAX protease family)